jgi:hypothetical protein
MKKLRDCLIAFWISIFLMIIITAMKSDNREKTRPVVNEVAIIQQDTTITKEQEYLQYQKLQKNMDKNMMRLKKQSEYMDSLLNCGKDTTKIK